jgi:hypothetical protein
MNAGAEVLACATCVGCDVARASLKVRSYRNPDHWVSALKVRNVSTVRSE